MGERYGFRWVDWRVIAGRNGSECVAPALRRVHVPIGVSQIRDGRDSRKFSTRVAQIRADSRLIRKSSRPGLHKFATGWP
eukprot:5061393-Prymnesium_polylepis.1